MEIKNLEKDLSSEQISKVKSMLELANEMIIRFVSDKMGGKISEERITSIIEKTRFFIDDSNLESDVTARYETLTGVIRLGRNVYDIEQDKDILSALSAIIHELQHKFSKEISTGDDYRVLDEGFSDVFAEECINYTIQHHPDLLKKAGIKKQEGSFISSTDYNGENDFLRAILETIRQLNGRHYEAEYEYIFGDKKKFLEIVQQTIGIECVDLIEEQRKTATSQNNLGDRYDYSYNSRLKDILRKILQNTSLEFPFDQDEEYLRADGTFNVFLNRRILNRENY